jgi:hypothetical protein
VRQCQACNTVAVFACDTKLLQVRRFGRWLPKHAALVKSISYGVTHTSHLHGVDKRSLLIWYRGCHIALT